MDASPAAPPPRSGKRSNKTLPRQQAEIFLCSNSVPSPIVITCGPASVTLVESDEDNDQPEAKDEKPQDSDEDALGSITSGSLLTLDEENRDSRDSFRFSRTNAVGNYMRLRGKHITEDKPGGIVKPDFRRQGNSSFTEVKATQKGAEPARKETFRDTLPRNSIVGVKPPPTPETVPRRPVPKTRHTYIASTRFLQNRKLVGLLERECSVDLLERDYDYLKPFLHETQDNFTIPETDLILDVRTALVTYSALQLCQRCTNTPSTSERDGCGGVAKRKTMNGDSSDGLKPLLDVLIRSAVRYEVVWIVIDTAIQAKSSSSASTAHSQLQTSLSLTPPIRAAIHRLQMLIPALSSKLNLETRLALTASNEDLAHVVRLAGETAKREMEQGRMAYVTEVNRSRWDEMPLEGWCRSIDWEAREFLGPEGLHERFLCKLQLGSFAAQTLLTLLPLRDLLATYPDSNPSYGEEMQRRQRDYSKWKRRMCEGWVPERILNRLEWVIAAPFGSAVSSPGADPATSFVAGG